CRMYRSARGVWFGLAKNAREGMAATGQIWFWTVMLLCGQVLPFLNLAECVGRWLFHGFIRYYAPGPETERKIADDESAFLLTGVALIAVWLPRILAARRFRQSPLGVLLHPIAILLLLVVQWYAFVRAVIGKSVEWKGR